MCGTVLWELSSPLSLTEEPVNMDTDSDCGEDEVMQTLQDAMAAAGAGVRQDIKAIIGDGAD